MPLSAQTRGESFRGVSGGVFGELFAREVADVEDVKGTLGMGGDSGVVNVQVQLVQRVRNAVQEPDLVRRADFDHVEEL